MLGQYDEKIKKESGKPLTYETVMLDFHKEDRMHIHIGDLFNFTIEEGEKIMLTMYTKDLDVFREQSDGLTTFVLCLSDDPYMSHAGDWMHLGCFRARVKIVNPKVVIGTRSVTMACNREDYELNLILPNRVM